MLDNLADFKIAVHCNERGYYVYGSGNIKGMNFSGEDTIFCPQCGDQRQVSYIFLNTGIQCNFREGEDLPLKKIFPKYEKDTDGNIVLENLPWLIQTTCLQCKSKANIIIYQGPNGVELVVLHSVHGGCITPNSPEEVKFYIDQAYRARSMGAISAAMAMYRSALEWILHEQGFTKGLLGDKIQQLEKQMKENKAPAWAKEINPAYLSALKEIGNGAIHTNNGDITKQQHLDDDAIKLVDLVFAQILDKIYEKPHQEAQSLAALQKLQKEMKKT